MKEVIKVCIDPYCEEVAHHCPKQETRCRTCGMVLIEINEKTYEAKFRDAMWQIDYRTGGYYRPPIKEGTQLKLVLES